MARPSGPSRRRWRLALVAVAAPLFVTGCGDDGGGTAGTTTTTGLSGEEITEAGYAFHDSSVPPEYHRSWTLTVTAGQAYIVVDSYGDVVGEDTAEIDASMWGEVQANVAALEGDAPVEVQECAGGTSSDLWAWAGDDALFELSADVCGAENGTLVEEWEAAFDPVLALFDMEALLGTGE